MRNIPNKTLYIEINLSDEWIMLDLISFMCVFAVFMFVCIDDVFYYINDVK